MSTIQEKVLLERNLFKIIIMYTLDINELFTNYTSLYSYSLVCKKWRLYVFKLLTLHFDVYNYKKKQFDFDNIISCHRIVERKYFESDTNNPYKHPNIKTITKYRFTHPNNYEILVKNSELKNKHKSINAKFSKINDTKICIICSTIVQARTICGNYLKKLHRKKQVTDTDTNGEYD
jgi:hypothetical protein